jgi:cytochrome c
MDKMKLTKAVATGIFLAVSLGSSVAMAADGARLYRTKTCNICHGDDGKTPILPVYPKLAGQNKEYLIAQMRDIKTSARNNGNTATMRGIMYLVDDEEIEAIAEWLESLETKTEAALESKQESWQEDESQYFR